MNRCVHRHCVAALLAADADPNIPAASGYTALHYAAKNGLTGSTKALLLGDADHGAATEEGG